ncbi:acyltransferase family protein [Roseimaritima ulvae]|uniref:Acyltransferase family protein n=1 Tax=Roseimaritima ulvae TaxID=980254 RepID=A0A5B9R8E2_9BACT|nr:acyltransferase [Roseimaritima ulvae]QEG42873.1 Acyltransferase family protein [Roseimaritima ulvae]
MQPSEHLKQSFRIVGLLATVLVVCIHYRSADTLGCGLQGWAQEWIVNGLARVAVPLFAFAAGFFYFLSATGTLANYASKLRQRVRTVALPYLLMSLLALTSWASLQLCVGTPITLDTREIASRLLLHPMAEQLWFLRDLMMLVLIAPLIGAALRRFTGPTLMLLVALWVGEIQFTPLVAGWYLLNSETLFFFVLGAYCVTHMQPLERLVACGARTRLVLISVWAAVLTARVWIEPEFDLWYVQQYTAVSLLLQKLSIAVGAAALLAIAGYLAADARRAASWRYWAGCSFMVYLIHEFPLREGLERGLGQMVATEVRFWLAAPLAILICFAVAVAADMFSPTLAALLTGGRMPGQLARRSTGPVLSQNRSV